MSFIEIDQQEILSSQLIQNGFKIVDINNKLDFISNLKKQLEIFNNTTFSDNEFERILKDLNKGSIFQKAKRLREVYGLRRDNGDEDYIYFFKKSSNIFQFTNLMDLEYNYGVIILINGLPLVQINLKRRGMEIKKAFSIFKREKNNYSFDLLDYIQIFVINTVEKTCYFSNNDELNSKFTITWKDKNNRDIHDLEEFSRVFLTKEHLTKMIKDYMIFQNSNKQLLILRPYQYYAIESIINQALTSNENGYIWHATGSGKTLTSFKAADLLTKQEGIDKVLFIVDREDLDNQTTQEFNSFSEDSVDRTNNTKSLIKKFNDNDVDLIVTTLQKLNHAIINNKKELLPVKDSKMIFMFDECHRSQGGDSSRNIFNFFTNVQSFGFTGTPIFEENSKDMRTTKYLFDNRLHTYSIRDAIDDGNVLEFSVQHFNEEKVNYSDEKRLEQIVDYIINCHDDLTHNRTFTSIFAVESIETLIKYYNIFKSKNHDLKIVTIFSASKDEDKEKLNEFIQDYNEMFGTSFTVDSLSRYKNDVSNKSKKNEIDILLVVQMFLTGFDNKYVNTLYVDRNLEYHGLLQAFSRTNRILNEKKRQGIIYCFRSLKKETDAAIKLFSNGEPMETVIMEPYEVYLTKFNKYLEHLFVVTPIPQDVDNLEDENEILQFFLVFRELLRTLNQIKCFKEFKYDDLNISKEEFENFKEEYSIINDKLGKGDNKYSKLNYYDFELELINSDNIDVNYIFLLLKGLNPNSASFSKERETLINKMCNSEKYKNKVNITDEFINEEIINNGVEFEPKVFNDYLLRKKEIEINKFIDDENLKESIKEVIEEYEKTGKINIKQIRRSLTNVSIREYKDKIKNVEYKIKKLVDTYNL